MADMVESMMYVGEIPWHGLGKYLGEKNVSGREAYRLSGADFTVGVQPFTTPEIYENYQSADAIAKMLGFPQYQDGRGKWRAIEERYGVSEDHFATVRERDGRILGAVKGKYKPIQNDVLFTFGDNLKTLAGDGVKFHTAGVLKSGALVWALMQAAGSLVIRESGGKADSVVPFLCLYTSHDGSCPLRIKLVHTRVVCWNTLSFAFRHEQGAEVSVMHTANAAQRIEAAKDALGLVRENFEAEADEFLKLQSQSMTETEFLVFAEMMLTGTDTPEAATEIIKAAQADPINSNRATIFANKSRKLRKLFTHGIGNAGETKWDAFNAWTQAIDHGELKSDTWVTKRLQAGDINFESSIFGNGNASKGRALDTLLAMA
jgi:phage/plasmid-like protein (TIGR03299 family)